MYRYYTLTNFVRRNLVSDIVLLVIFYCKLHSYKLNKTTSNVRYCTLTNCTRRRLVSTLYLMVFVLNSRFQNPLSSIAEECPSIAKQSIDNKTILYNKFCHSLSICIFATFQAIK